MLRFTQLLLACDAACLSDYIPFNFALRAFNSAIMSDSACPCAEICLDCCAMIAFMFFISLSNDSFPDPFVGVETDSWTGEVG